MFRHAFTSVLAMAAVLGAVPAQAEIGSAAVQETPSVVWMAHTRENIIHQ